MTREEDIERRAEQENEWFGETGNVKAAFKNGVQWADKHPKDNLVDIDYVYVIMHCGEHVDYVEKVFLDEDKANSYCKKYDELDNQYRRYVYKIEVTL